MSQTIYAYISDGGIQEEISQGAGRIAGHLGLDNLIMYYDANNIQLSTTVEEVDSEDVAAKYKAWGWHVIEIDGCCPEAIRKALREAKATVGQPTLIIGKTIMGRGAVGPNGENYENRVNTHGQPLSAAGASIEGHDQRTSVVIPKLLSRSSPTYRSSTQHVFRSFVSWLRLASRKRRLGVRRTQIEQASSIAGLLAKPLL